MPRRRPKQRAAEALVARACARRREQHLLLTLPRRGVATGFHVRHRAIRKTPARRLSASSSSSHEDDSSSSSSSIEAPAVSSPGHRRPRIVPTPEAARKTSGRFFGSDSSGAVHLDPARFFHHDRESERGVRLRRHAHANAPRVPGRGHAAARGRGPGRPRGPPPARPREARHDRPPGHADRVRGLLPHVTHLAPGSSGAPIFDDRFRLVGVHVAGNHVDLGGGRTVPLYEGSRLDGTFRRLRRASD